MMHYLMMVPVAFRAAVLIFGGSVSICMSVAMAAETLVPQSEVVTTSLGPVTGTQARDASIEVFKGIPYAAPPIGELRWRPPQPAESWTEVRNCDTYSDRSLQMNQREDGPQSEDCLYLNIWTPQERSKDTALPVMVWIHGGGFTQGSGHQASYDGTQLAKRGVVVVTINYRLGALGFMTHPALSAESPEGASGNYAILDQIAALKWVQENIGSFGGDPNRVTIFGESAGGTSVYLLTATPLAQGLFHGVILQSPWLDPAIFRDLKHESDNGPPAEYEGEEQARLVLGELADASSADVLKRLRALPAEEILSKIKQRWPVVTDGWVFPNPPYQIYADGEQHDIPVLIGTNRDEGTMFAPRKAFGGTLATFKAAMVERFGADGERIAEFYAPKSDEDLRPTAVQMITDAWFVQPAREFARAMEIQGTKVWMYHFTKPVWGWMGAAHAAEIGYVFGNLQNPNDSDSKLSDAFMDHWVQFAATGDPNLPQQQAWPQYTLAEDQHLIFDDTIAVDSGLRNDACDLLDQILKTRFDPAQEAMR